jgi:DNA-binding transcriptional LysR family regulator
MDKLKAMETFVRIAEAGSLSAAAARMGTSLTAVVRSLASLEQALGVRLLNRTTRRIALTEEGREYLERCRRILAEVDEADAALTERRLRPTGRLSVTAPVMFGRLHVAPVLTDFLATHPDMRADLLLVDRVIDLLEEGLDLAVRIGALPDSSLVARPLGTCRRVLCASPDFAASQAAALTHPFGLADLRSIRFAGLDSGPDWQFERAGARPVRARPAEVFSTNLVDAALEACRKGLGCGRFLSYQVHDDLAAGRLVRLLPEWEPEAVPVQLVFPHSRLLSVRVRAFVDWAGPRLAERLGSPMIL